MARGSLTIDEKITEREKKKLEEEINNALGSLIEYCCSNAHVGTHTLTGLYTARQSQREFGDRLEIASRMTVGQALTEIMVTLRDGQLEPRVDRAMDKLLDSMEKKAARP